MPKRKIGRREFLKLATAAAGAAGLSHFRILNIGGIDVAYARECEVGSGEDPDVCSAAPASVDWCIPLPDGDPDLCSPDPGLLPSDMCPDNSPTGDGDRCQPDQGEPDICAPWITTYATPDTCEPAYNDPDVCYSSPQWIDPDVCDPTSTPPEPDACGSEDPDICNPAGGDPDECENGQEGDTCTPEPDPDICPDGAGGDGDQCVPAQADPDICPEPFGGAGDTCQPGAGDPDVCSPTFTPDVCEPPATPADEPNPVTVGSMEVDSASSILPALGGVVAAFGAAALWLRHRLRPEKPEEEESA